MYRDFPVVHRRPNALTLRGACCYVAKRMNPKLRRYLLLFVGILGLAYFFYKFRNAITLEGFRWSIVGESLWHANIPLLLLAVVTTYACFAIRALRWMRFSRAIGETRFWNVYRATLMGFACTFLLGRAGEPVRPVLIARKDSLPIPHMFGVYVLERVFDMAAAIVLAGSALLLFERQGLVGGRDTPIMRVARSTGVRAAGGAAGDRDSWRTFSFTAGHGSGRKLQHETWRTGWREKVAVLLGGIQRRACREFGAGVTWRCCSAKPRCIGMLVIVAYLWNACAGEGNCCALSFAARDSGAGVYAGRICGAAPRRGRWRASGELLVLTLILGIDKEPAATAQSWCGW